MSLEITVSLLMTLILVLMAMAFYTLMERKFLGYFQIRKGPNKPSIMGIPQPFADAIKLFTKEQTAPVYANYSPFMMAPLLSLTLALFMLPLFPHPSSSLYASFGILYFLCISSMTVYATFAAGWASNSKYALLGALRGVAQTISYEVSMSLILIACLILTMNLNLTDMNSSQYTWPMLLLAPIAILWIVTNLAETNRTPFDFAEGESELVSGFNVEYGSGPFALIFMAEYTNILVMSMLSATLFFPSFIDTTGLLLIMKTVFLAMMFVWIRATLPRMRYDNLMSMTWKCFLPFALLIMLILMSLVSIMM